MVLLALVLGGVVAVQEPHPTPDESDWRPHRVEEFKLIRTVKGPSHYLALLRCGREKVHGFNRGEKFENGVLVDAGPDSVTLREDIVDPKRPMACQPGKRDGSMDPCLRKVPNIVSHRDIVLKPEPAEPP